MPHALSAQDSKAGTRTLILGVRSESAYEQNPLFSVEGPEDISTQLSGTADLAMILGRSSLTLGGQVDRSFYRRLQTMDRFTYAGSGAAHYTFSPRFSMQAAGSYATLLISGQGAPGTAASIPVVDPATIAPPVAEVNSIAVSSTVFHSLSVAGGASYNLSELTAFQLQGSFNQVSFDTTGVPGGSTFGAGGTLQHRFSERTSGGLAYQYQTNSGVTNGATVQSVLGSFIKSFERYDVSLQLGAVSNATTGVSSWIEPAGGAQLQYRIPRGALNFAYNRSAAQAFGLGKILISDEGTVGLTQKLGAYTASAFGTASHGHDTQLKSYTLDMYSAGLGVTRPLLTTVTLNGSLYYRRRSQSGSVAVDDRGVRMLVTYGGHYF